MSDETQHPPPKPPTGRLTFADADGPFAGIYQIVNTRNGKRYIGQAVNIHKRLQGHKQKRNKGTRLYNAIAKYGWENFKIFLVERVDDISKLDEREQFWMDTFQSYDGDKGYNICRIASNTRGRRFSEKTRARLREIASGRTGEHNGFYGKHHSEETKRRIGTVNATKIRTEATKAKLKAARSVSGSGKPPRPVAQVDVITRKTVRIWPSLGEAARHFGASLGSIIGCCRGVRGRKTVKGWIWRYVE